MLLLTTSLCNPSDDMYGGVRNTWLHILPPCSRYSMVDLFELYKCHILLIMYDSQLSIYLDDAIN